MGNLSKISTKIFLFLAFTFVLTLLGFSTSRNVYADTVVSGTISTNTTWTAANSPYTFTTTVTIAQGVTLTIEPGVVAKATSASGGIKVNGKIDAVGTSQSPIVFTTYLDSEYGGSGATSSSWLGITVASTGEFNGDYTKIRYGGKQSGLGGNINTTGKLTLTNSESKGSTTPAIVINSVYPVIIRNSTLGDRGTSEICINNSATGNITIENNTISTTSYGINFNSYYPGTLSISGNNINCNWPIFINFGGLRDSISSILNSISNNILTGIYSPICLSGTMVASNTIPTNSFGNVFTFVNITIPSGMTLTVSPGVILKACGGYSITVNGKLNALGTAQSPIVFTKYTDADYGGNGSSLIWYGITVANTGEFNGDNIKIRYSRDQAQGAMLIVNGKLSLTNSEVVNTGTSGSGLTGIFFNTTTQPVLAFNTIANNPQYSVRNYIPGSITIDASYNYWGTAAGPSTSGANRVSSGVNYTPWLGSSYNIQVRFGEDGANEATGNFSRTYTDMVATAPGFDLKFSRTYNSKDSRTNGPLSRGWRFGFEGSVKDSSTGSTVKVVTLPNGSVETFNKNSDGSYMALDSRNQLVKQADNTFILTTKDQYSYGFDVNGYLVWMKDKNDNTVTITVDANGKVTGVTDGANRQYTVAYNAQGQISTITDPIGRAVTYEYENNLLVRAIDPMGNITRYSYDESNFLNQVRDNDSNLIESIVYNHAAGENQDKVSQTTDAFGNTFTYTYDNTNRKTTITDTNGRSTLSWYDGQLYSTNSQDAEGKLTVVEMQNEANGINKYGEEKSVTDRNGNKTQYERDTRGNITKITNPDNSYKEYTYDDKNNVTAEKDELGNLTYYVYDAQMKNIIKKVQPLNGTEQYVGVDDPTKFAITSYVYYTEAERVSLGYLAKGLLHTVTDPAGNTTTYTYDAYGDIQTVTDPEGKVITNTYNNIGWKTSSESASHYRTDYIYDHNGNIERTTVNDGDDSTKPITENSVTRVTYDTQGRKTKDVSPNLYNPALDDIANHIYSGDHGYRYTYYTNGKVHTVTDPENNVTSYTYDLYGNVQTETKANDSIYTYEYDVMNRLTKVWFKDNAGATAVLLNEYTYTILADKTTKKTEIKHLNDTENATTIQISDYADRPISVQNPDATTVLTSYNTNGTVNTTTDANGNVTYYKFDGLNRLTEKWTPFETVSGSTMYTYTATSYDNAGKKTSEKIGKDEVALYTPASNLISTNYEYYANGKVKTVKLNSDKKKEYTYDDNGNVSEEDIYTDSVNKNVTEYINNYLGKPVEKKVHVKQGDLFGNDFSSTTDVVLSTIYTYDKNGNVETVTTPDNVTTTYTYDNLNSQTSVSQPGVDENDAPVTISNSTTYDFAGNKTSTIDGNGNVTTYTYNQRGFLEKVTDAKDGVTAYYYDRAGRKIAEVTPLNYDSQKTLEQMNRTEYSYDLMDRVKTKTNIYLDPVTSQWVTAVAKAYKYDNNGNVLKEQDALGYENGGIDAGYGTEYTYNYANKVVTVLDPVSKDRSLASTKSYEYDAVGRKTKETNANGAITIYVYDDAGNVLMTKVKKTVNDPEQIIKINSYDFVGNVTSKIDGNSNVSTFEYNAFNKIRSATYPGDTSIPSNTVTYQYDVMGNLAKQEDSTGTVDLYTYDNQNRALSHTQEKADSTEPITTWVKYDKNGNKRFETDGNETTKTNVYDELNRLISSSITVSGTLKTTTYDYDANSNQTTQTDWRGNTYTNVYDPLNRLIEKKAPDSVLGQKTIQKLEYNHNGVQVKSYDALNNLTQYSYDKNNRLLSTQDPQNHITSQTYDNVGNIETKTDGNTKTTTYGYDEFNRLVSVLNAKDETTSYTYDLNNNMLTQEDGAGNVTTFEYNAANKATKKIDQGGVGVPAKTETYTYHANRLLHTKTDRNGNTTTYTYDSHGRMLSQAVGSTTISYTYDNNGNQLTIADATGTATRTYDELNRVETKTVPVIGTSTYTYDITTNMPTGFTAETTTDPKNNVTTKVYDKEGRLAQVIVGTNVTTYTYYDNGAKESVVYPDGTKEEYTYYSDNLLNTLTNKKADNTVIDQYSYNYDAAHNQTSKVDSKGTTSYTYDNLERLETVTEPSGKVTTYAFDAAGNRLTETVALNGDTTVTTYTYNEQNRLLETLTTLNSVTTQTAIYVYDNNGNELTETTTPYDGGVPQTPKVTTNVYDLLNQLVQTVTADNVTVVNGYNGEGYRTSKSVDGVVTHYLYEYDKVVLETDSNNNQKARNVYGTNLICRTVDNQTAYYLYNGHADTTALIDNTGTIVGTYYYDSFGNLVESTGSFDNPFTYVGYMYDSETKTYYLMARMYDPEVARFLQEDSYRGDVKDVLSLNLYTYCHNEPLMYSDPTGHVYLIMWSYEKKDLKDYKKTNGTTDWKKFTKENPFARAAYTKKQELIESGVKESEIDIQRIDNKEDLKETWTEYSWYKKVDGLDVFSHGYRTIGPEVAGGTGKFWGNEKKLKWSKNAEAVFHGCDTAEAAEKFANRQNVLTYGQLGQASFSADMYNHIPITSSSKKVYLFDFEWPSRAKFRNFKNIDEKGQGYYPDGSADLWGNV